LTILERVEQLLREGEELRARDLTLRYRLLPGQSPEEYLRWGRICEDLALPRQARECYQKALSKDPDYTAALRALASLSFEIGDLAAAKRLLLRCLRLDPEDREAKDLLAAVYRELNETGSLKKLLPSSEPVEERPEDRFFPRSFGPADLECLEEFLFGREAYKELILHPRTGEPLYLFRERPLTADLLRAHLSGEKYILAYPISEDLKVRWAAFEVEFSRKEFLRRRRKGGSSPEEVSFDYVVRKAFQRMEGLGLPVACETYPLHLKARFLFLFSEPVHFLWVKRFLEHLKELLPYPEGGVIYRPFTLTSPEGSGWRENAIPLPLGVSPVTEARSFLVDEDGDPIEDDIRYLKKLRRLSLGEIKRFCRARELSWQPLPRRPEVLERLCQKCPLIGAIVRQAERGARLTRQEKLALFLTVGLLDPDGRLLHELLQPTPDYRYTKVERQRRALPPNPISCYKLREWFPGLASECLCACVFEDYDRYPSPLLHVKPELVPPSGEVSLRHKRPEEVARFYRYLLNERERLSREIERLERELKGYLDRHPGRKIRLGREESLVLNEDKSLEFRKDS